MAKETKYRLLQAWQTPAESVPAGTVFTLRDKWIYWPTDSGRLFASAYYADAHPDWFEKVEFCTKCKKEVMPEGKPWLMNVAEICFCADNPAPNEDFQVRALWGDLNCTIHIGNLLDRLEAEKAWRERNKAK